MRCCRFAVTWLATLFLGLATLTTPDAATGSEEKEASLDGMWSVISMTDREQDLPKSMTQGVRFVFFGNKLTMHVVDKVIAESEFAVDPTKKPPTIRMTYGDKPTLGIYQLDGDDLKICLSGSVDERPTKFTSELDSANRTLIILKRGEHGPAAWPLFVLGIDGTGLRPLGKFPRDMAIGSPDVLPDGKMVAFDAWRLARNETYSSAHVYVVNVDGTGLKDIAVGAMPSWSPDGDRITFCQYSPKRVPGQDPQRINGDMAWFPDGKSLLVASQERN